MIISLILILQSIFASLGTPLSSFYSPYWIYWTDNAPSVVNLINAAQRKSIFHHLSPLFHPLLQSSLPYQSICQVVMVVASIKWFQTDLKLHCLSDGMDYASTDKVEEKLDFLGENKLGPSFPWWTELKARRRHRN